MEAGKWIKYIYSMYCTLFSSYEKAQCQGKIMRNIQYSTIRFSIQLIYILTVQHIFLVSAQHGNCDICRPFCYFVRPKMRKFVLLQKRNDVRYCIFVNVCFSNIQRPNSERSVNKIKVLTTRTLRNSGKGPHHHKKILKPFLLF